MHADASIYGVLTWRSIDTRRCCSINACGCVYLWCSHVEEHRHEGMLLHKCMRMRLFMVFSRGGASTRGDAAPSRQTFWCHASSSSAPRKEIVTRSCQGTWRGSAEDVEMWKDHGRIGSRWGIACIEESGCIHFRIHARYSPR